MKKYNANSLFVGGDVVVVSVGGGIIVVDCFVGSLLDARSVAGKKQ